MSKEYTPCAAGEVRPECVLTIQKAVTDAVKDGTKDLAEKVDTMHKRIFIDNGKDCFQTEVTNLKRQTYFQWWVISGLAGTLVAKAFGVLGK